MHTRETIYKRTNSGAVQIWYGQLEGNKFRTTSGQQHGKHTTSEWTVCEGKNLGRSNETSPEQQAAFELDAMYKKRLEREYRRDIGEIDVKRYTKPQKCLKWHEDKKKWPKPGTQIAIEPKFDGMRALGSVRGIKSQDGKIIPGAPHLNEALEELFIHVPDIELDGELYNHKYKEDFESLMSALKTEIETQEEADHARAVVQYHLYDVASHKGTNLERRAYLEAIYHEYLEKFGDMFQLSPFIVTTMDSDGQVVADIDDKNVEDGFEGSIVRILTGRYENKRSNNLFKVKTFMDDEFVIVDVMEGKGNWTGHCKAIKVQLPNGNICKAGVKGDKEYCRDLWLRKEELIGKVATVTFLRWSKAGMLNLPVFKSVRWDA